MRFENIPNANSYESGKESEKPPIPSEARDHRVIELWFELENSIGRLVHTLKPHIAAGDYNLIIGDDASGRIATLILGKIIKEQHNKLGIEPPEIRFIAGGRRLEGENKKEKNTQVNNYLDTVVESIRSSPVLHEIKRALIVTDWIASGESIEPILVKLKEIGIETDIAAVGVRHDEYDKVGNPGYFPKALDSADLIAEGKGELSLLYHKPRSAGVTKKTTDLFSRPYISDEMGENQKKYTQESINAARKRAAEIAERVIRQQFPE